MRVIIASGRAVMSHLVGDLKLNYRLGVSLNAVLKLTLTGQPRRKILFEFASLEKTDPRITVALDRSDRLYVEADDGAGNIITTAPLKTRSMSNSPTWLQVEAVLTEVSGDKKPLRLTVRVWGKEKASAQGTGKFGVDVPAGKSSVGSSLDGSDPATFALYETVIVNRAPLTEEENRNLEQYFRSKHLQGGAK